MALTAKKVYAILKRQISDMEAKLNSPVRYRGTVATADLLPLNPDIGDMYNIESKSVYGEAGMNVAWNGVVWDTMGAPIDMSLYIKSSELADWVKQQNKPTYTAEEVGALPDTTVIPSKTSDLQNDSGFLTKIPDNYLSGTDKTLSVSGKAADAKATGDKITELSADISNKLNKNQGSENSGKIAGINESGDIVPMFPVSVDYNEETNCLEFGSDQKMELNKGINLDSTLTKTGYAADAGAVGEITDSLKEDITSVEEVVYLAKKSKNLYNSLCDSGAYLINNDGTIVYPYSNVYSVIIPVESNKVITIDGKNNGDRFAITTTSKYPANETPHTGLVNFANGKHFTIPSESKYLIIYVNTNGSVDVSGMRVYYGETWNDEDNTKTDEAIKTANLALNNTNSIKPKQTTFFEGYNYGEPSNVSIFDGYVNEDGLVIASELSSLIIKNIKPDTDYYIYIPNRDRQKACISDTGNFEAGKTYTPVEIDQNLTFNGSYIAHIRTNSNAKAIMMYFYNGKYDYEKNKDNIIISEGKWDSNPREHIPIKYMPGEIIRHYGTFSIVGDSYSSFKGYMANPNAATWYPASDNNMNDTNDVENVEQTWWYKFANTYNSRLLENNSWSSSTIAYDSYSEGLDDGKETSFIKRMNLITTPQLILIYGGTNDSWVADDTKRDDFLGEYKYSDFSESDFIYFRPALAYLLDKLKHKHIGAKIIFMLNSSLSNIKESVHEICNHYGIGVCEITGITLAHSHPTDEGMTTIAKQIIEFLETN